MYRRVIAPALIAVGISVGAVFVESLWRILDRAVMDSMYSARQGAWLVPVIPRLDWAVVVGAFLAARLCASRGGSRTECIAVALAPMAVAGLFVLTLTLQMAGLWVLPLGLGLSHPLLVGGLSVGTAIAVRAMLQQFLGLAGACLAATWLYFFAARHMQERPFWLAAEESQTQVT